jgi:hypothetical protein
MARGRTRSELTDSFRLLVREERWLPVSLLGGSAGYFIWMAGTAVAAEEVVGPTADVLVLDGRVTELWLLAFLWVVVPSVVAVRYVVDNLTNIRGNVEKCYRVDRPLVLLAPPVAFVLAALAFGLVRGAVGPPVLVALGAATIVLLVRTVAYGYRVYSLSFPRLFQALLSVAAVATSLGLAYRLAPVAGKATLVESTVTQYGLGGAVAVGGSPVSLLALVGATAPGVVAVSYLWTQVLASLIVRIRGPDVPRSAVRPGQRYPQVVQPGTEGRLAVRTATGADADEDGRGGDRTGEGQADPETAGTSAAGTDGTTDSGVGADGTGGHRFGQTRVYRPPEEDEHTESERCPICHETYPAAGYTNCPNCNAVVETD